MRTIERTNAFRRDFKREKRGHHRRELEAVLTLAVSLLAEDKPLSERNRDHALSGEWRDHRECHLKPDLLLIYRLASFWGLLDFGSCHRTYSSFRLLGSCLHSCCTLLSYNLRPESSRALQ